MRFHPHRADMPKQDIAAELYELVRMGDFESPAALQQQVVSYAATQGHTVGVSLRMGTVLVSNETGLLLRINPVC